MVIANFNTPLMVGQSGYTLTCIASGAENLNPAITYQWTRNYGTTQTQVGINSKMFTLGTDPSPLQLSNAGNYECRVTVGSSLLNNDIMAASSHRVTIQSELTMIKQ